METVLLFIFGIGFLIGLWGLVCLFRGMTEAGGFFNLIRNWIKSLSGEK